MKKEIAKLWTKALRSGKYQQTTGVLQRMQPNAARHADAPVGFCCLGVLCELAIQQGVPLTFTVDEKMGTGKYENSYSHLPYTVREWAGMQSDSGEYNQNINEESRYLINDNDGGASFTEIADIIDANVESL